MPTIPSSMVIPQTMASGMPSPQRMGLGIRTRPNSFTPLRRGISLITGAMGSGKSYLIESLARCLRINLDLRPNTSANPLCDTYPFIDNGTAIGPSGSPVFLNWDDNETSICALVKTLVEQAKSPHTRLYDTIAWDTIDQMLPIAKIIVARRANKPNFRDLIGWTGWDLLGETIYNDIIQPLRDSGYGLIMTAHIITSTAFADEKATGQFEDLRISASIRKIITPPCNMICRVEPVETTERRKIEQQYQTPQGPQKRLVDVDTPIKKVLLLTKDSRLPNFLKITYSSKFPNPLALPENSPWDFLEAAYSQAAKDSGVDVPVPTAPLKV
mgnify:CR=1 FL=1